MIPDLQIQPGDELLEFDPAGALDVPLYWQQWRLRAESLERVAAAVHDHARSVLQS